MPHTNFIDNVTSSSSISIPPSILSSTTSLDSTNDSSLVTANMKVYHRQSSISNKKSSTNYSNSNNIKMLTVKKCEGCGEFILDLYHLVIASKFYWHLACLKCNLCGCNLKNKCFIKNGKFFCTEDYFRITDNSYLSNTNKCNNNTCKGCFKILDSDDYVIRVNENYLYHLNCFKCNHCSINLKTGQMYGFLNENLYCDKHYLNELTKNIKCEPKTCFNEDYNCNTDFEANAKIKDEIDQKPLLLFSSSSSNSSNNDKEIYYLTSNLTSKSTSSSLTNSSSSMSMSPNEENSNLNNTISPKFDFSINYDQPNNNKSKKIKENENENTKSIDLYCQDSQLNQIKTKLKQRCLSETTTNIPSTQHNYLTTLINSPTHIENSINKIITPLQLSSSTPSSSSTTTTTTVANELSNKQENKNIFNEEWSLTNSHLNFMQKKKRMRTSFKHQQLRIMKAYFQINQNPDSKELKDLSDRTNLSKRTLQVWFQNSRAKQRKTTSTSNTTVHLIDTIRSTTTNNQQLIIQSQKQNNFNFDSNYDEDDYQDETDNEDCNSSIQNDSCNNDENNENIVNDINNNKNIEHTKLDSCLYNNGIESIDDENRIIATTINDIHKDSLFYY